MVLEKKNFKHFSYFFYVKLLSPPGAIVLVRSLRFLQRERKKERERGRVRVGESILLYTIPPLFLAALTFARL